MLWKKRSIESLGVSDFAIYSYGISDNMGGNTVFEKFSLRSGRWTKVPSISRRVTYPQVCEFQHRILYCYVNNEHNVPDPLEYLYRMDIMVEEAGWKQIIIRKKVNIHVMFQESLRGIIMFGDKIQ